MKPFASTGRCAVVHIVGALGGLTATFGLIKLLGIPPGPTGLAVLIFGVAVSFSLVSYLCWARLIYLRPKLQTTALRFQVIIYDVYRYSFAAAHVVAYLFPVVYLGVLAT